jgi:hypothetical protein
MNADRMQETRNAYKRQQEPILRSGNLEYGESERINWAGMVQYRE